MANKRVTATTDPLVVLHVYVPKSQKDYLDSLEGSASDFFRKLISAQMDGHEAEIAKLEQEERQLMAQLNIVQAQLRELRAETDRQQDDIARREQLLNEAVEEFVRQLSLHGGYVSGIQEDIGKRVKVVNEWLAINKPGIPPITFDEVRQAVIAKARAQGVKLYA